MASLLSAGVQDVALENQIFTELKLLPLLRGPYFLPVGCSEDVRFLNGALRRSWDLSRQLQKARLRSL